MIVGLAGPALSGEEATLLRAQPPAGAILFRRNVEDPAQLRALTRALRAVLPPGAAILVDQEGGRVARLRPPHWRAHPPAGAIGALHARDAAAGLRAAWLTGALIGLDCAGVGIDMACAPVLDLRHPGAHDVVGDRSFGADPRAVADLGRAMAEGLLAAGVVPVGKHAPGHGRARADSHLALPEVDADDLNDDMLPFVANAQFPAMMTAHIRYAALDPERPATLSPRVVGEVIRGRIGFDGLLLSDDLAMQALSGTPAARALGALAAGCDLALYCPGDATGNAAVLAACPALTEAAARRLTAARTLAAARRQSRDGAALAAERERLLGA
ncbi:MAG: beta-N-acetylhexosaminidase [Rhodospirillales bacterium]|nr:beta-N-acetylhexosaminidase [Rhodospirillales bacterium]